MSTCTRCGQEAPDGAIYCPHCCGGDHLPEAIRGGVRWGLIGLSLGLVVSVTVLSLYGFEKGIKAIAFAVPVGTFTTGLLMGLWRHR